MMAEIGKHLDLNSKLRLRLALVKHRQGDVVEMLKEPLKVLYVSPSRTSLRNFKQICQCEYFQAIHRRGCLSAKCYRCSWRETSL
ncbi:hypothetical protein CLAFUR0_11382, partial [Fulvia fulva]